MNVCPVSQQEKDYSSSEAQNEKHDDFASIPKNDGITHIKKAAKAAMPSYANEWLLDYAANLYFEYLDGRRLIWSDDNHKKDTREVEYIYLKPKFYEDEDRTNRVDYLADTNPKGIAIERDEWIDKEALELIWSALIDYKCAPEITTPLSPRKAA